MEIDLNPIEARVLGVLMEKEATTPDAYPLSLNATVTACNQKTNRDPVMELDESEVMEALDRLAGATLVRRQGSAGGRIERFSHRLDSRLFGELEFDARDRAVLCSLLLRGAQTPGEIRTRAGRLHGFQSIDEVESVLSTLTARADGPFVQQLAREPGRRESRFVQLFCPPENLPPPGAVPAPHPLPHVAPVSATTGASAPAPRTDGDAGSESAMAALEALEARITALEKELEELRDLVLSAD